MGRQEIAIILFLVGAYTFNWPILTALVNGGGGPVGAALRVLVAWFCFIAISALAMTFLPRR